MEYLFSELFNSDVEAIRQLTEALPAGVYITDTEGQLIYFNPAALEKSGRQLELNSRRWYTEWDLYFADGRPMSLEEAPMVTALEEERPVTGIDMLVIRPDGRKIDCIAHSAPLYNDENELVGCITLLSVPAGENDETVPVLQGNASGKEDNKEQEEDKEQPEESLLKDDAGNDKAKDEKLSDMIERRHAERILRRSEQKYRTLFESMNEGFCILQIDFNDNEEAVDYKFQEVNSAFYKQAGLNKAEGMRAQEVFADIRSQWFAKFGEVALTGEAENFEIYSDNLGRWFNMSVFRIGDAEERKVAVLFVNITEQKENELNNAYLSAIINSSDDAIVSLDLSGKITSWNESAEEIFGYTADEAIGRSIRMLVPEEQRDQEKEILSNVKQGESVDHYETIRLRKDGSQVNISLNISQIKDSAGNVVGMSKISRDITERVRAHQEREQVLREVETERQRLNDIFKRAPSFMAIVRGPNHVFERANDLYHQLTGNRELKGKPVREALPEVAEQGFINLLDQVYETGEAYTATDEPVVLRRGDDQEPEERFVDFVFQPMRDPRGEVTGVFVQGVDLTERRMAKQKLQQMNEELEERVEERTASLLSYQQQLRSLSSQLSKAEEQERHRLAAELHDNLGQMLAVSKMKVSLLEKDPLPEEMERQVEDIKEGVDDALTYTRNLMSDLKPPPSLDKEDVTASIEWVASKMKKHNLQVTLEDDGQQKRANENIRTTLLQSVRETLFNVVKHAGVNQAHIRMLRVGDYIHIVVEDEGAGFYPHTKTDTSNESGGFGLFNIQERMDLLGGRMEIDSAPGKGTRVTLIAPAKQMEQGAQTTERGGEKKVTQEPGLKQNITVMLVDDHQMIRDGLRKIINDEQDLQVIAEASDGKEALEKARESKPDIVVMDVNMPNMNGIDATREITDLLPEVRVIGLSLHDHEEVITSMRKAGATAYVTKNEAFETLVATLRSEVM